MRFNIGVKEAQYIQKSFKFSPLIGLDRVLFAPLGVEKKLISEGVIKQGHSGAKELDTTYRYLFSAWEKMRYSIVNPNREKDENFFCVLSNENEILLIEQDAHTLSIELIDFKIEIMDNIITNMLKTKNEISCNSTPYNIALSMKDFSEFLVCRTKGSLSEWSGKLGLSEDEISSFLNYVNDENSFTMLLCEDHIQGIGMLLKTVPTNQGIYALKHITPKDLSKEKMVLLKGSLQNIVDSVYVF